MQTGSESSRLSSVHASVWLVPTVALFVALQPLPYGYYTFLRLVVCCATAYLAYETFNDVGKTTGWVVLLGGIALLFNPLLPVH